MRCHIFGGVTIAVERLPFHEEKCNRVYFRDNDAPEVIAERISSSKTNFTEWMVANQKYPEGRCLTYVDYPTMFTWHDDIKAWKPQESGKCIDRIYYVTPAMGEKFYLRMLLNIMRGARSHEEIRTVNRVVYPTYMATCKAYHLLGDDTEWIDTIRSGSQWQRGLQLIDLFVSILLFCDVADIGQFFTSSLPYLAHDVVHAQRCQLLNPHIVFTDEEIQNYTLLQIESVLNSGNRSLFDFPELPHIDCLILNMAGNRFDCAKYHQCVAVSKWCGNTLWYGCGGTGKTYLWRTIISRIRLTGKVVLSVASSGIASLLLPGGRTSHSRFRIPIDLDKDLCCAIDVTSDLSELIKVAELIIYDEAPLQHRHAFEAVDRTFRDICKDHVCGGQIKYLVARWYQFACYELYSADSICQTTNNLEEMQIIYPTELLNTLHFSGIPNHKLELKVGVPIILLRNLNMQRGDKVLIHRIDMTLTDSSWLFQFRRRQFPRCMIHAKIPVYEIAKFENHLQDGRVYQISKFKVLGYGRMLFRPLAREVYVQFSRYTRVVPSYIPLEAFPRFLFVFVEYENLKDRYNDDNDNRVHVTIWGELASKFDDEIIESKNDHSVVVVFTCCRAKEYNPLVLVVFTGMNENRPVVIHISDLFEKLMAGVELDSMFILDVNVVGVDLVNDWKFVQCNECFGKATWNKDNYFCEKKYKLVLKVGNGCHVMDCVFFNQYVRNLLGVSVDDLINKALTLGADNPYWIEDYFVMNLYGERVVIKIKVDKFNLPPECSRRFTVVKYFGDHSYNIPHLHIIHVVPKLNGADVNGNHVGQYDIMRQIPNDPDLNGQQFCHSDILHVSQSLNVANLNGQQLFHSDILPIQKQQMLVLSMVNRFSEAILANVADTVDHHMQDDIIPVSSVSNDVDQYIVHDTSHVMAKPNDSHIVVDHIRDTIPLVVEDNFDDVIGQ
ncbi:hypothetical protein Tco_0784002 [Tanacetum coccineum]